MFLQLILVFTYYFVSILTNADPIPGGKFSIQSNNSHEPIRKSENQPKKTNETSSILLAVRAPQPFEFPSQEQIEQLIREQGFALSVLGKLVELVYGILTAPFRWVYRVGEFFLTVLKLGAESFRQMGQRRRKKIS